MEKKCWRFYQRQIDHNSHHNRNILRINSGKRKTTKGVPGCYGYHETCLWNSGWCPCQGVYSLQKMDQRVIQLKFYGPHKGNKITQRQMQIHLKGCATGSLPSFAGLWAHSNPSGVFWCSLGRSSPWKN